MDSTNDNPVRVTLGDFEIHEELGRGGMGVVYRARQISLNRIVALKVLKGSFTLLPTAVERFQREAAAAARLHHSSIVPIYSTGSSEDQHFYAMELIEGFSLDKVLDQIQTTRQTWALAAKRAPLTEEEKNESLDETEIEEITSQDTSQDPPLTEGHDSIHTSSSLSGGRHYYDSVARIIADVADALDYAHGRGVIHRDIKPGNLILSNANRIYITDFGLARVQEEQGLTVTGGVMGSPHYMSPEQVTPGHEDLDHRTDIYSLGVTLYELITLQAPFKGVSKELVMNHILTKEPKLPRKLSKRVPHDLETICLKAMDKRADRRYQTASELAADLRRFVNRFAITARRVGPAERALRWSQRHPSSAGLIVASVVAVIALSGLWAYMSYSGELEDANEQARINIIEAGEQRKLAEAASAAADIDRATAESERAIAVNAKADVEDQKNFGQYVVNITRASHALEVDDGPKAEQLLEQIRDDPGQREMMGFVWGYLWHQYQQWQGQNVTPLSWQDPPWPLSGCSFSPGGEFLAVSGHYGRIMLIDGMNNPGNWAFHKVLTLATVKSDEWKYAWVNQVTFSPDGKLLAASSDDHTIRIWEMDDVRAWNRGDAPLEPAVTLTGHEGSVYDVAFSRDGRQMASASRDGTVKIWNVETPRQAALLATLKGHTATVRSVTFSPVENDLLASAADDGRIITWKRTGDTFEETERTPPNDYPVMSVAFSPDGRTLASGGLDSAIRLWNSESLHEIVPLNGHKSGVIHVTFSPDGKWIASTGMDQTVQVWDFKRRAHFRTLQGHFGKVWRSVFPPDGKGLVSVGHDGSAKVWNLTEAVEVAARGELNIEKGNIWSSRFSPDGTMIADIEGGGPGFTEIKIRLWENVDVDAGNGRSRELDVWTGNSKGSWMACDFCPDSTQFVYCKGGDISLWNLVSGKTNQQWKASSSELVGARFNPANGRQVAVWGKDRFVRLFDTVSQTETTHFPAADGEVDGVRRVEFFPNGKSLATLAWNNPKVLLWDVESGSLSGGLTSGGNIAATCLAVSPDSDRLAVGNWKGQITIWNAQTRELETTFSDGHRGAVHALAFLDDGRTLVSAAADSTVRFWNLRMFKEVVSMNFVPAKGVLHGNGIHDISTTARGSKLISTAGEPRIKIWKATK